MPGRAFALALAVGAVAACSGGDTAESEPDPEPPVAQGLYGSVAPAWEGIPSVVTLRPVVGAGVESGGSELASEQPRAEAVGGTASSSEGTIDQFGLAFSPTSLLVRAGGTLRFTNSEAALNHNVQVILLERDSTILDDDAAAGQVLEVALEEPGGYVVLCEYHPGMTAFVYASVDPIGVVASPDGSFVVAVEPGEYLLRIWSADPAQGREERIVVGSGATEYRGAASG